MTTAIEAPVFEILLVEDEPADAHLARLALKEANAPCRVHHAQDGAEALAFLRRDPAYADAPRPDMVVTDLNMPRVDGLEVIRAIKGDPVLSRIPVIVLTTSDADRDIQASYGLGANSYITKPMDMDAYFDAIRTVGAYWFNVAKLPH